jgi:hypothetical protein
LASPLGVERKDLTVTSALQLIKWQMRVNQEIATAEAELDQLQTWTPDNPQIVVVLDTLSMLREERDCTLVTNLDTTPKPTVKHTFLGCFAR